LVATMISGSAQVSSGILFVVVCSILSHKLAKSAANSNQKANSNKNLRVLLILGVILFLHGVQVFTFLLYFDSVAGNVIFYWLERFWNLSALFCFLYSFIAKKIGKGEVSSGGTTESR
jgi:hypothetical protein